MIYPQKIQQALNFASEKHQYQKRKISKVPYIIHPMMVFHIVSNYTQDIDVLCAAILHDMVEDTDTTLFEIEKNFGKKVVHLVDILSEDKSLPHKEMKEIYFHRMYNENNRDIFLIKSADIIYNLRDVIGNIRESGYKTVISVFNITAILLRLDELYSVFRKKWPENPLLPELKFTIETLKAFDESKGDVTYQVSCGIIPVYKNNNTKEFLLVQNKNGNCSWSFPKGHMDSGEMYLETAQRELFEETGLVCASINEKNIYSQSYLTKHVGKRIHKTVHYFIGYVDTKDIVLQIDEVKDGFWGSEKEVLEKITYNGTKDIFKKALSLLR